MLGSALPLVLGALAVVLAGGLVLAVWGLLWVRRVRRRWRAVRVRAGFRSAAAVLGALRGLKVQEGPSRWRVDLWQAVGAATRAARTALDAGGSTPELPRLCARLNASAQELDRLLASAATLARTAPERGALQLQVADAVGAATAIQRAAIASATDAGALRLGSLAEDARIEVEAVTSGIERARSALSSD